MTDWADRIRARREGLGLNQTQLAKLCGLRPPSINDWESGKTQMIDGRNLVLAARALQTTAEWIMTGGEVVEAGEAVESQSWRLNPEMIAESIEALRRVWARRGLIFDPVAQPEMVVYAYELLAEMGDEPTTAQLIDFGAKLAERDKAKAGINSGREEDKQSSGANRARSKGSASKAP